MTVAVLDNDSDPEGDNLTIDSFTQPSNGTVTDNGDGTLTYTPNGDYNGPDSFTYTISDGNGRTDIATVDITVDPVNDAPNAQDDTETTDEDTPVIVAVLTNDSDPENDPLTIDSFTQPSNGTVTDNGDGTLTYTPDGDYNGPDSFTYTISDGNGGTDTATVDLDVAAVNDLPQAVDDFATVNEDGPSIAIDLTSNDFDPDINDDLEIQTVDDSGTVGTVTINPDNDTVRYDPNGQFESLAVGDTATDTFTYTVSDGNGGTDVATVTVTILGENDAPVVDNPLSDQTTRVGTPLNYTIPADTFSDIDNGDTLTYTATLEDGSPLPSWLDFDETTGTFSGTPDDYTESGIDTITVTANDGNGGTATTSFTLTVEPLGPTVFPDGNDLIVLGTDGADRITVYTTTPSRITVSINYRYFTSGPGGTLSVGPGGRVRVYGLENRDTIQVHGYVPAEIHGGEGDDYISGSSADDVIFGGTGNDYLIGNYGNDLLIGGMGIDRLIGGFNNDLLIGDDTTMKYDDLYATLQVWATEDRSVNDAVFDALVDSIVADDTMDLLAGGTDKDAFFASTWGSSKDRMADLRATDLDAFRSIDEPL